MFTGQELLLLLPLDLALDMVIHILGYPYYGYPYGYPNPYGYSRGTPYKLSLQIQSIKIDYKNQIRDTRHNKSLSHSQKRQEIRTLKTERDQDNN